MAIINFQAKPCQVAGLKILKVCEHLHASVVSMCTHVERNMD